MLELEPLAEGLFHVLGKSVAFQAAEISLYSSSNAIVYLCCRSNIYVDVLLQTWSYPSFSLLQYCSIFLFGLEFFSRQCSCYFIIGERMRRGYVLEKIVILEGRMLLKQQ